MNFDLALQTMSGTLVCPFEAAFDKREGHGLQAAMKSRAELFSRREDAEKAGCEEWREGLPIQLSDKEIQQAKKWQASDSCGMLDFAAGFIFSCELRNSSDKASAQTDSEPQPGAAESSSQTQTSAGSGPSFNCSKAKSEAELLICGDAELSEKDRALAALYAKAKAVAPDPVAFRKTNTERWTERETQCTTKPCLLQWYASRTTELEEELQNNAH